MLARTSISIPSISNVSSSANAMSSATTTASSRVRQARQHDAELVAAEPGDGVLGAEPLGDPSTDLLEELVARLVPERVVDLLEAVEVEQQRGRDRSVAQRLPRDLVEPVGEKRAVGEVGEDVVQRLVAVRGGLAAQIA